jgi:hypothetical protein
MIERWFTVRCDGCGDSIDPIDESEMSLRQVQKDIVQRLGWKREKATAITKPRDLCSACNPDNNPPPPKPVDPRQMSLLE